MATKRRHSFDEDDDLQAIHVSNKKHTLDSDEEDSDEYEKVELNDSDVEGEEDGVAKQQDDVQITPFNMREELEEGHFDDQGHYHWNKDSDIKDNWLDNIDWVKVKENNLDAEGDEEDITKIEAFNEAEAYAQVLDFMTPNETVQRTLQRLGKNRTKISSAERIRPKKLGIADPAAEKITKFTELTNEILTKTGNMDIYQETYEHIKAKLSSLPSSSKRLAAAAGAEECDMYANDFEEKEKARFKVPKDVSATSSVEPVKLQWEYKWKQDDAELHGPFSTEQMFKWTEENYFKGGVYVRKVGESTNFYTSNRIDFGLYL